MTVEGGGGGGRRAGGGEEEEGEKCDVSSLLYLAQHISVTRGSSPPHSNHGWSRSVY